MSLHLFKPPYDLDQRVWAKFARQNKNSTLQEYREQCATLCGYDWNQCRIDRILVLSQRAYDELSWTLLEPQDGFAEMGGTASDSVYDWDGDLKFEDEAQREDWIRLSYCRVILACAPGREPFVIDPQGHPYARYVGLDIRTGPPEVRNPGNPLGRWVLSTQNRAIVCGSCRLAAGKTFYPVIILDDKGRAKDKTFAPISCHSPWRWAYSNPDYEKMSPEQVTALEQQLLKGYGNP